MSRFQVFYNPKANRGKAGKHWPQIESALEKRGFKVFCKELPPRTELQKHLLEANSQGIRNIVAAGGDGTLQAIVEGVFGCSQCDGSDYSPNIGVIGMGTSNDFLKPFPAADNIAGLPCRIDEMKISSFDVIRMEAVTPNGSIEIRHFLQSCHAGTIARTNMRLIHEKGFFNFLYKKFYPFGLIGTAAWEVFTFPGFKGFFKIGNEEREGEFLGLSIIKRPYIAGNFKFLTKRTKDDGLFDIAICEKVSSWRLISLIGKFEKEGLNDHPDVLFRETNHAWVRFSEPQPIDYDGEIIVAKEAKWSIIPKAINIMG
ncbi:hypothetical protein HYY75_13195 [bacterium]|nr:hypothetical protein [bacterium]